MSVFKRTIKDRTGKAILDQDGKPTLHPFYSYNFRFKGKQHTGTTKCTDAKQAEKEEATALKLLVAGLGAEARTLLLRRSADDIGATVLQVITEYLASDVAASPDTRHQNVKALRRAIRVVKGGTDADNEKLPFWSTITAGFIKAFFASKASGDNATKKSANSDARKLASLWTPRALEWYEEHGIKTVDTRPLDLAHKSRRFRGEEVKTPYTPPDQKLIDTTLAEWQKLDRDMFLVVGCELAFGLRKSDMQQVTWDWFKVSDGRPCVNAPSSQKNGASFILVQALDPFYSILMARIEKEEWRGKDAELLIQGTPTYCSEDVYNNVSAWMRHLGWKTTKTNHVFRAYAGSQVAMRYDLWTASSWLRHGSVEVTQGHYMGYVKRFRPEDPSTLPCSWAKATQAAPPPFVPKIVAA